VPPLLVNEDAVGPEINPLKELYSKQFGGGPDEAMLKRMDSVGKFEVSKQEQPKKKRKQKYTA
jgi:arylsulfatase